MGPIDGGHVRGEPTARRAECGDVVQQAILGSGRQVAQQTLGQPGGRPVRLQAGPAQRGRPVLAQIGGHGSAVHGGLGAHVGHRGGLELDHPGLVDLEHRGARRPRQPVCAGVQPGRQDHHLRDAGRGRRRAELVKVAGAHRHPVDHRLEAGHRAVVDVGQVQLAGG